MTLEQVRAHGVVGAGGAGFPAHVKLAAPAEVVIVNAAECEPLLHKDKEVLKHYPEQVVEGVRIARGLTGARRGVIGIKEKYHEVIEALGRLASLELVIRPLGDYYPAGDEFLLVYEVTGRVIPPGGLPRDVGALVLNVETLLNIAAGEPVTTKFLTVAGAVARPVTVRAPVGVSYAETIERAGGATVPRYALLVGGAMMGRLELDASRPVVKTDGGILVLPLDHMLIERRMQSYRTLNRIGKSACDQCSLCTELCPRYLLGHPIHPHMEMRGLLFSTPEQPTQPRLGTLSCCECNLCSLYACPEDLDPKNVCVQSKTALRETGRKLAEQAWEFAPHEVLRERRAPLTRLTRKLGLHEYVNTGPLAEDGWRPARVVLPLKQHAGVAADPVVRVGDQVREGQVVADVAAGSLGVPLHASIAGRVAAVTPEIIIERTGA
jgi:Na+-translocating ferredoxin:NAD+ oxidoreductase RnfC subunit